jgi:hypothetical protein
MNKPMDRGHRVFSYLDKFENVFPQLEDVMVEWIEGRWGGNITERGKKDDYEHEASMKSGGLFTCSNTLCQNGGYEVDREVSRMIAKGEIIKSGSIYCAGNEGSRRMPKKCGHVLCYRITLTYKNNEK